MKNINLSRIRHNADLARDLGCGEEDLNSLIASSQISHYHEMKIPKKNPKNRGSFRVVYQVTNSTLELLQKNISKAVADAYIFPEYVQGFTRGRSIVSNASQPLSKKFLLKVDIQNFFESIKSDKVEKAFQFIGCNFVVASSLSKICTLNGCLPQGASSSPIIANLVCREMDEELYLLSKRYFLAYTRYADDITFSGDSYPSHDEIAAILKRFDFSINDEKIKVMKRGQNQYVTGLTVFDANAPRVPRKMKRNLRLILYYAKKYGLENHLSKVLGEHATDYEKEFAKRKIKGWIDFINSVEPTLSLKYSTLWTTLEKEGGKSGVGLGFLSEEHVLSLLQRLKKQQER